MTTYSVCGRALLLLFLLLCVVRYAPVTSSSSSRSRKSSPSSASAAGKRFPAACSDVSVNFPNFPTYTALHTHCPVTLNQTFYYYTPPAPSSTLAVSHLYAYVDPRKMFCDSTCLRTSPSVAVRDTVARTEGSFVEFLRRLLGRKSQRKPQQPQQRRRRRTSGIPWCELSQDTVGAWVPKEFWGKLAAKLNSLKPVDRVSLFPHLPVEYYSGSSNRSRGAVPVSAVDVLGLVLSGDRHAALTWPYTWIPSHCRYFRYNVTSFLRCASRWRARHKSPIWIALLGDSTTQGLFCGLLRVFATGGECAGIVSNEICFAGIRQGSKIRGPHVTNFYFPTRLWSYSCPRHDFRISFHPTRDAANPMLKSVIQGLMGEKERPTHIVYNSGAWDHVFTLSYIPTKEKFSNVSYLKIFNDQKRRPNTVLVNQNRPKYIKRLLSWLRRANYSGRFIYRNNYCNSNFDARLADVEVEEEVRREQKEVFDVYNFSICRGTDHVRDAIHIDRHFAREPPPGKPSLGELNLQIVQSMLNAVCNPFLLKTRQWKR